MGPNKAYPGGEASLGRILTTQVPVQGLGTKAVLCSFSREHMSLFQTGPHPSGFPKVVKRPEEVRSYYVAIPASTASERRQHPQAGRDHGLRGVRGRIARAAAAAAAGTPGGRWGVKDSSRCRHRQSYGTKSAPPRFVGIVLQFWSPVAVHKLPIRYTCNAHYSR